MRDYEIEFVSKRNQLILKYGEDVIKVPGYKSAALNVIRGSFAGFPNNLSFKEQMQKLESYDASDNNVSPLTKEQEQFVFNRYCEIIVEGKNSKGIQDKPTLNAKIEYIKNLGYVLNLTSMGETKLETGHTKSEACDDLFDLYVLEYGLYHQNPNHHIFLNAVLNEETTAEKTKSTSNTSDKSGCLGFIVFLVIIASLFRI